MAEVGIATVSSPTTYSYGFAILFNWDEEVQRPFKIFPRKAFGNDEISERCYTKDLPNDYRIRKLKPLKPLPGQKMSFFAKVESCKLTCFIRTIIFINQHSLFVFFKPRPLI